MPITRGAKKALRQDRKRRGVNRGVKHAVKEAIKSFKEAPTEKSLAAAFSLLDRAGKKKIFHANKTSRLKAQLSKLIGKKAEKPAAPAKAAKKPAKKKPAPAKK